MKDSTAVVPRKFVVFSCETQSISSVFTCGKWEDLASNLSEMSDFFDIPAKTGWRRLAREAFLGSIVSVHHDGYCFLVLPTPNISFYDLDGTRFLRVEPQYWTPADLELSRFEEEAMHEMGIVQSLLPNDDGTLTFTKVAPDGTSVSRTIGKSERL